MSWDIIVWKNENAIDFVPSLWRHETHELYKYPEGLSETKIRKLVYDCLPLEHKYTWHEATTKKRDISSLAKAKNLCNKGQETSTLETSSDDDEEDEDQENVKNKRPKKKNKRYLDSDADISDIEDLNRERPKITQRKFPTGQNSASKGGKKSCSESSPNESQRKAVNRVLSNDSNNLDRNFTPGGRGGVSGHSSSSASIVTSVSSCGSCNERVFFELKQVSQQLSRLENRFLQSVPLPHQQRDHVIAEELINLPSKDHDQLVSLNNIIKADADKFAQLVNLLYLLGGVTPQKCVYMIMDKLFAKDLAVLYSGQGKKKKKSFQELESLNKCVFAATRKRHPEATDESIKKSIGLFLATAKSRLPNRVQPEPEEQV